MDPKGLQPPERVLACLRVLAALGNVPKTVRGLKNVISPLSSFTTRVVSPSLLLAELCRARPGDLRLSCSRRWAIKVDSSLKDKAEAMAREKALHHDALFFEASVSINSMHAMKQVCERVFFPDREIPRFTSKASLVQFVADSCSCVQKQEPSQVLGLLKSIGVISSGPGQDDVIYITDGDALSLENLSSGLLLKGAASHGGYDVPSPEVYAIWFKAIERCKEHPELLFQLHKFLQRLREWGCDRPETEEALSAKLQPLCKVVIFCDPNDVLQVMNSRKKKKLFAVENCIVTLSPSGFHVEGEEEAVDGLLSYLKMRLLRDVRRRGSSLVWGKDLEEEEVSAVQRAEEWLSKRGVMMVGREEEMESGGEEKMETAAMEAGGGDNVSSLVSLQQEFVDLCISQGRMEPSLVVEQLIQAGVISVTEDGAVEYHRPQGRHSTPTAEDCVSRLIERERRELVGERVEPTSGEPPTGKRKGKRFRGRGRKSQRLHT